MTLPNEQYPKVESVTYWQQREYDTLVSILGALTGTPTTPLHVIVDASALPIGASTSALQISGNNTLSSIDSKIVHVDTGNVTVVASALPTGAATSANQSTEIGYLLSLDSKTIIVDTSNVSVTSSALPAGAATAANQVTGNTSLSSIDSKTVHVDTNNVTVVSSALPTGAATEATLSALNSKVVHVDTGNVTISTALPAGTNSIGNIGTLGSITGALPSGTNTIGKVDQASTSNPWVVSGTVTATGTVTANQGTPAAVGNAWPTYITDGTNPVTVKALNNQVIATDFGLVTNSVIHGLTTGGGGGYVDVKVTPSGALTAEVTQSASSTPWQENISQINGAAPSATNPFPVRQTDGADYITNWVYGSNRYSGVATLQGDAISSNNSSTANLASSAVFTGAADTITGFGVATVSFFADQPCTIQVQQSQNGTNWDIADTYSVSASTGDSRAFQLYSTYLRLVVQNTGAGSTTVLRLQTTVMGNFGAFPRALTTQGNFKVSLQETNTTIPTSSKTPLTPAAPTFATVGTSSASAVAANANRKGLILINTSGNYIYLGLGFTAVIGSGIVLIPFGTWTMDEFTFTTAAINAIASGASSNLSIQEFS